MPIYQQGSLNTTSLVVPDLYVQIVSPQNLVLNGVPSNLVGIVGTASWGAVNQPTIVATMSDYMTGFGPVVARKYDMGTQVATAVQQGAANFRCVRVTDGTDTAASYTIAFLNGAYPAMLTALYTGSFGNNITFTIGIGSQTGTWRLAITMPGQVPEVYDNIPSTTPASFWAALVSAVNSGNGPLSGPSQLVVASLGSATSVAPAVITAQPLLGGSDGAITISATTLIGQDILPRSGMYALRSQSCSIGVLADTDDPTQWTIQAAFGLSEGVYMILTGPAGDTITDAVTVVQQSGLDSYAAKLMFGDWIYWSDLTNNLLRLVSPQGFVAGRLANLSPEQSSLNKQLYSVIGSQKSGVPGSGQVTAYSDADLQVLVLNGIDVIANPQPGGSFWGVRIGHNSSSNPATNGDNYTRMTNFIAATLAAGMGQFVGQVINASLFARIRSTEMSFLQALLGQGILAPGPGGSAPFSVICNSSNNPLSRTSLGYVQSDVQVLYQGINEKFIVNVEGGQTVLVQRQILPGGIS